MIKSNSQTEPWVQLQQKTMIKWMNSKIHDYDQLQLPPVPASPTQITNLNQDLQSGLMLIKLINRLIYDYHQTQLQAKSNTTTNYYYDKLYYITPIYSNPKFKLQMIENLNDILKFLRLILKLNTSNISSDNIFEGDLKLILGLIWSLYLFNMSSKLMTTNDTSSFFQIKQILFNWLSPNVITITNFTKDWINPVPIFTAIFTHYNIKPPSNDLECIISFMIHDLNIPILVDVDDFPVDSVSTPDEKCIVTLCVELYKFFEVDKLSGSTGSSQSLQVQKEVDDGDFNELIEFITHSNKLKNKFETKSLRFINKINTLLNELTNNLEPFNQIISTIDEDLSNTVALLFQSINTDKDSLTTPFINECLSSFTQFKFKLASLTKLVASFLDSDQKSGHLIHHDYDEISDLLTDLNHHLNSIDLIYYPSIKSLNIENLQSKVDNLTMLKQNYSSILRDFHNKLQQNSLLKQVMGLQHHQQQQPRALNVGHTTLSMECTTTVNDIQSFVNQIDYCFQTCESFPSSSSSTVEPDFTISPTAATYNILKLKLVKLKSILSFDHNDNLTHFQLIKLFKSILNLNQTNIEKLIKLVPLKSIIISSHSFSSALSNGTLSTDDDYDEDDEEDDDDIVDRKKNKKSLIFDELQQKLDSELSGTRNKVYDVEEFLNKLDNGFKL